MVEHDLDIESLFEGGNEDALLTYLRLLHPADIAELFPLIDSEYWPRITRLLEPPRLAEVLAELDEGERTRLGERIPLSRLTEAIDELETDDATDVLHDLPDDKSEAVLKSLEDRAQIAVLLAYPEDSAGGIMQKELCRVPEGLEVRHAIEAVRRAREDIEDILEVYVVDPEGHLKGTVSLEDLVLSDEDGSVEQITTHAENTVTPEIDQEEVAQIFTKYDLVVLPVVSPSGLLLGRITFDDIHDVLEEEATEDMMHLAGASPEELVYGGNVMRIAFLRMPWLVTSFVGSLISGFLLTLFAKIPGDAIVLASFVPVVMAMTGNVGAQTAMIITRGFATGQVDESTLGRTFVRELTVGLILGAALGPLAAVVAHLWYQHAMVGFAVGASVVCSMSVAAAVGVVAPVAFKRIGVDPAIAAGPLVTTGSDVLGVLIYLGVAILVLA